MILSPFINFSGVEISNDVITFPFFFFFFFDSLDPAGVICVKTLIVGNESKKKIYLTGAEGRTGIDLWGGRTKSERGDFVC